MRVDNPLLQLFEEAPPGMLGPRLTERLGNLAPHEQSARWIEQLLADPRLDSVSGARASAVKTLLGFGHPLALRISPEELARFRASPGQQGRVRRWTKYLSLLAAGPLGTGAGVWALGFDGGLPAMLFLLGSGCWSLTVFARAITASSTLPRAVLLREAPAALFVSAVIALDGSLAQAMPVIATAVTMTAAAVLARWLDD